MFCNTSSFVPPFTSSSESWLYTVFDMGDIDFGYIHTQEEVEVIDENLEYKKAQEVTFDFNLSTLVTVISVSVLVIIALLGNSLVIMSVLFNKAMRSVFS